MAWGDSVIQTTEAAWGDKASAIVLATAPNGAFNSLVEVDDNGNGRFKVRKRTVDSKGVRVRAVSIDANGYATDLPSHKTLLNRYFIQLKL